MDLLKWLVLVASAWYSSVTVIELLTTKCSSLLDILLANFASAIFISYNAVGLQDSICRFFLRQYCTFTLFLSQTVVYSCCIGMLVFFCEIYRLAMIFTISKIMFLLYQGYFFYILYCSFGISSIFLFLFFKIFLTACEITLFMCSKVLSY